LFRILTTTARIQRINRLDTDFHNTLQRHQIAWKNRNWIMFVLVPLSRGCLYQIPHAIELRNRAGKIESIKHEMKLFKSNVAHFYARRTFFPPRIGRSFSLIQTGQCV
jgi:hypothetical protein